MKNQVFLAAGLTLMATPAAAQEFGFQQGHAGLSYGYSDIDALDTDLTGLHLYGSVDFGSPNYWGVQLNLGHSNLLCGELQRVGGFRYDGN